MEIVNICYRTPPPTTTPPVTAAASFPLSPLLRHAECATFAQLHIGGYNFTDLAWSVKVRLDTVGNELKIVHAICCLFPAVPEVLHGSLVIH